MAGGWVVKISWAPTRKTVKETRDGERLVITTQSGNIIQSPIRVLNLDIGGSVESQSRMIFIHYSENPHYKEKFVNQTDARMPQSVNILVCIVGCN